MAYHGIYETPADLLNDEQLSPDEKIEMLESWRDDKEAYMRAADEGMQGSSRSELLRHIERALFSLREDTDDRPKSARCVGPTISEAPGGARST